MKKNDIKSHLLVLLFCMLSSTLLSQTIIINQTFQRDTVFDPFSGTNSFYKLQASGTIKFTSDTSLVRLIFMSEEGYEFMVFESYPMIAEDSIFDIVKLCDETCFMNGLSPDSLRIELISSELKIDTLYYDTVYVSDAEGKQYEEKKVVDEDKIEEMSLFLDKNDLSWEPGNNSLLSLYYQEKKSKFGEKYNLQGYDYYVGGIYRNLNTDYATITSNVYTDYWDWRTRHGANIQQSPYYDGDDSTHTGWMTIAKNQGSCGACAAFADIGVTEAMANLYYNQHLDFDLSEQELVSCAPTGGCSGSNPKLLFKFIEDYGVVSENCFEYIFADTISCDTCSLSDTTIFISGYDSLQYSLSTSWEDVQLMLIEKGPLAWYKQLGSSAHEVVLVGWVYDAENDELILISKDSQGTDYGSHGFVYEPAPLNFISVLSAKTPIVADIPTPPSIQCLDEDGDGYYYWGIGPKPSSCDTCPDTPDCDDSNPNLGPFESNFDCDCSASMNVNDTLYISGDTTWSGINTMEKILVIQDNGHLTVTGKLYMPQYSTIFINPGGQMTIDSGLITKACHEFWEGIQVLGDTSLAQQPTTNQGYIELKNNGQIEYAKTAVLLGNRIDTTEYLEYSGGIIMSRDAIFRNNIVDVEFLPYNTQGNVMNYSRFKNTNFITEDTESILFEPEAHIILEDIFSLRIENCEFAYIELDYVSLPKEKRGTGIISYDGGLWIRPECISPPGVSPCQLLDSCSFTNLRYGVRAFSTGLNRNVSIHESVFTNCIAGIYLSGFNQPEILLNEFYSSTTKLTIAGLEDAFYGDIYLDECSGYHIEGNSFESNYFYNYSPITNIGIYIKDSGSDDNEIYNNVFNFMYAGIVVEGINKGEQSGLCLKCNDYNTCMNDMMVIPNLWEGTYIGIKVTQGSNRNDVSAPAGNTFTDFGTSQGTDAGGAYKSSWNYLNYSDDFIYYHHLKDPDPLTYPTEGNYTDSTIALSEQVDLTFSKSLACPSGIATSPGLKSFTSYRTAIADAQIEIDFLQNQYDSYVDGGNTDETLNDIILSMPDDAMSLRQQLINESPYLSDTIMKQAIAKENVLPNAMIRDILVANPQAAKRNYVLDEIDNRFNPMPDYLMAEIMLGGEIVGAKENLESQLSQWKGIRQKAINGQITYWLTDTNLQYPIDSVHAFYLAENSLESQYRLAFSYLDLNKVSDAIITLNNIPQNFSLSNAELAIYNSHLSYFTIIQNRFRTNGCLIPLDSSQISELKQLMEIEYPIISAYARGTLIKEGVISFTEKVKFPDLYNNLQSISIDTDEGIASQVKYFNVFPNPANNYAIAYLNTAEFAGASRIDIFDMNGRLIRTYQVNPKETEVVLDIGSLPNGVYNLILVNQNEVLATNRLIKQ